jgi:hypothetical protein
MGLPLNTPAEDDIYGGRDPRDIPFYSIREAALCLDLNPATLRTWALGRKYPVRAGQRTADALLELPDAGNPMLSFVNLMEAQFLRAREMARGNRERSPGRRRPPSSSALPG